MIKQSLLFYFLLFTTLAVFSTSCIKEEFDFSDPSTEVDFQTAFAVPIGYVDMTLQEYVEENDDFAEVIEIYIEEEDEYLVHLLYRDTVYSQYARDLIYFDDLHYDLALSTDQDPTETIEFGLSEDVDGEIHEVKFKTCQFEVDAQSTVTADLTLTLPSVTDENGIAFQTTFETNSGLHTFDLSNYTADLYNNGEPNTLPVQYEVSLKDGSNPKIAFDLTADFKSITYHHIKGYTGQLPFDFEHYVKIKIYDDFEGNFYFENPEIKATFHSTFGLPVRFRITQLMTDFATLNFTDELSLDVGSMHTDSIVVNRDNMPSVLDLFNDFQDDEDPDRVYFTLDGLTNPNGYSELNFVTDSSRIDALLAVDLPVYGWANLVTLSDTMQFDYRDIYDENAEDIDENIEEAVLRFNFTNWFPVEVHPQIVMVSADTIDGQLQYTALDTLLRFDDDFLDDGTDTNGDGKVDTPNVHPPLEFSFKKDDLHRLAQANFLIVQGRITTTDAAAEESMKFYADYGLKAQVGLRVLVKGNTSNY